MVADGIEAKKIVGYLDPLAAAPGTDVAVKVSAAGGGKYRASLVRIICGDSRPHGTGYQEEPLPASFDGDYAARHQPIVPGSYASLGEFPAMVEFGFGCWVYPTTPEQRQTVVSGGGFEIRIEDGRLSVSAGGASVRLPGPVAVRRWHRVVCGVANGELRVRVQVRGAGAGEPSGADREAVAPGATQAAEAGGWWFAATSATSGGTFNGRIEAPFVSARFDAEAMEARLDGRDADVGPLIAAWDFSRDMARDWCDDMSGNGYVATLCQQPTRAVTGVCWDGTEQDWRQAPSQYGAIHFHDDDLVDAGWQTDFVWRVPDDLPSGVYAVKVEYADSEDLIPVFVRPSEDQPRAPVALLMSTATYLAYANQRVSFSGSIFGAAKAKNPSDAYLMENPEVGYSLYEYHGDGSGVHFSSWLRPVLNLKPKTIMWSFNADTNLIAWLTAIGQPFDVITDHDLHACGADVLAGYSAVITGAHPEYYSTAMLDGLDTWLGQGGRLMYMGGNGFYWRIAFHPDNPAIIEVRRAEDGTRAWIAEPGEYFHQFSGEYGGLWRRLGRPPNRLVGVGFAAQGFDGGTYYRLNPDAIDTRAAWILDGVQGGDVIGDYGTQGGGAAGEEIDRFDPTLGSPEHGLVIATSEAHRPGMLRVKEEFHMTVPVGDDAKVRADMTFFETPAGGAVFSTGSISYAGGLSHNGYHNDIATITGNVLTRFLDPTPFAYPHASSG